jgi:HSP20 family protein
MPGYDPTEITLTWDNGILNVAAETDGDTPSQRGTFHRRFRFPKRVDEGEITAEYTNGILEVRLPVMQEVSVSGTEIEVQS